MITPYVGLGEVQPKNANLTALAGLDGVHNSFPYFTATGAMTLGSITDYGKGLITRLDNPGFYSYTGIKTAGLRDVGTGAGQIPDMASFPVSSGMYGLPSGIIHQVFDVTFTGPGNHTANFPTAFALECLGVFPTAQTPFGSNIDWLSIPFISRFGFNASITADNPGAMTYKILAIGR